MRILLPILLATASLPLAAQTMQPGEWQFTSTLTSPVLPQPQSVTVTQCISKADADDPTRFSPRDQAADCEVTPGSRTPDSYSWAVACPKQGMRGTGKAHFASVTIESEIQISVEIQGQKMDMVSRTSGRRLGPCTTK
jgi:hypothetical protein